MLLTNPARGRRPASAAHAAATVAADAEAAADEATSIALLNCLVREICAPEQQIWPADGRVTLRLPRVGIALRARLARPPYGPVYRLTPPIEELRTGAWLATPWNRLADLVAGELELATGRANPQFTGQVSASRAALAAIFAARADTADAHDDAAAADGNGGGNGDDDDDDDAYMASEQALVAGHRFHPAPKARTGDPADPDDWLRYAPETRARFPLRWLAVRADLITGAGDFPLPGPPVPDGFRALPVHPWQLSLLAGRPVLRAAMESGAVRDLGAHGPLAVPTSSVRTVYVPGADLFCKFSLDVRITNCVRKNAWYELIGAVELSRLLAPVFAALGEAYGCALLTEPAYRSVILADRRLHEGLGVIVRTGVRGRPGTPLLAGALADPYGSPLPRLLADRSPLAWWTAYVRALVPPVLHAYLAYGVVLEPHLQNVLIRVDDTGLPVQAIFRDLEGTKLLAGRWDLAGLPARAGEAMTYDAERGWQRVVYCLFVNHLAEVAAAVADLRPALERDLWRVVKDELAGYAAAHAEGLAREGAARLRALLAGVPWPAKANLKARWARAADRSATYVTVPSPFADPGPDADLGRVSPAASAPRHRDRGQAEPLS
ncbi:MAG TPA: IucA/IucC family protein [Streptosporangiaceae bacterium]|nr:IucA/IucC family protein [Streptosporangiaceae bacterium]